MDLFLVLEDQEGGHGADAELLSHVGDLVDVELDEVCAGVFLGEAVSTECVSDCWNDREGADERDELRSDDFAGSAPGCEGVKDYNVVLLESGLEFSLTVNVEVLVSIYIYSIKSNQWVRSQISQRNRRI